MEIKLIDTGYFYADGGAMFGAIPKTAWSRRYPADAQNGCILAMRSVLVKTSCGKIILIDTGAGTKQLQKLNYYRFFDLIDPVDALLKAGVNREAVTDVILTHLHFDHCGDVTRPYKTTDGISGLELTFPNATHWVSRAQWENMLHPNALEKDSYYLENMQLAADYEKIRLIDETTRLCNEVELRLFDGHTPGQIVPYLKQQERTVVFAGDVIPLAASVSPEWISAYDTFPVTSYQQKLCMLNEAATENQLLIYCHDAYTPCSGVKKVNNLFIRKKEDPDILC